MAGGPTVLVTYPSWLGSGAITLDHSAAYWTMEETGGTRGQIATCGLSGCANTPTTLAYTKTSTTPSVGIAVDASHVYWTDFGRGEVLRLAK